jgi:hypothetical protein
MTSEDDTQTRLRVGGWLPPYHAIPPGGDPLTRPLVYRSHSPTGIDTSYELSGAANGGRRGSVLMFCAAVTALLLIGVVLTQFGGKQAGPAAGLALQPPAAPFLPPPPDETPTLSADPAAVVPAPTRATSRPPTSAAAQRRRPPVATTVTTAPRKPASAPTKQPTSTPSEALPIGAPISLELADAPGFRVRHRDFRGRVDRIGAQSPALDRADARFVVRRGLADGDCVSFESSNYPGRFLRHRDFTIRLDRPDGSALFTRDATFCPETRSGAGVVALRSHNYPDRFLTETRSLLELRPATTGTATPFAVRPPL